LMLLISKHILVELEMTTTYLSSDLLDIGRRL
jgi:hypothetical protein